MHTAWQPRTDFADRMVLSPSAEFLALNHRVQMCWPDKIEPYPPTRPQPKAGKNHYSSLATSRLN